MAEDFALVVGIDKYGSAKSLKPLNGAVADAKEFHHWLTTSAGVDSKNITMMTSDAGGTIPRLLDIVAEVENLYNRSPNAEVQIGRRLYIFLAGHGIGPGLDEAGLLAADTSNVTKYFPGRLYANLFRGKALFEQVVLCMDCCRDEDADLQQPYFPFDRKTAGKLVNSVKQCYVFATGFARKSRERDFGGTMRGVFTYALLEGLKRGAVDGDGRLTGASLKRYLKREIPKLRTADSDQDPDIRGIDDDFIFAEGLTPRLLSVTVQLSDPGKQFVVLYGKGLQPVATMPKIVNASERLVDLPAGKNYSFRLLNPDGSIFREVGETIDDETPNVIQL